MQKIFHNETGVSDVLVHSAPPAYRLTLGTKLKSQERPTLASFGFPCTFQTRFGALPILPDCSDGMLDVVKRGLTIPRQYLRSSLPQVILPFTFRCVLC